MFAGLKPPVFAEVDKIDPIDVYKNPQDYLYRGEEIISTHTTLTTNRYTARIDHEASSPFITRKPKTRKVLVRAYLTDAGAVRQWTSQSSRSSKDTEEEEPWFDRWLDPAPREYEIPVE